MEEINRKDLGKFYCIKEYQNYLSVNEFYNVYVVHYQELNDFRYYIETNDDDGTEVCTTERTFLIEHLKDIFKHRESQIEKIIHSE